MKKQFTIPNPANSPFRIMGLFDGGWIKSMTGAYLRVQRDGKWLNLEVEHLTDEERQEKLSSDPRLIHWLNLACAKLLEAEDVLNGLVENGVLSKQ